MKKENLIFVFLFILPIIIAFNPITSNVVNSQGSFFIRNYAPILDFIDDFQVYEGDIATINANASDLNWDSLVYSFSSPFNSSGGWQTFEGSIGIYDVNVSVSDGSGGEDSQIVQVTVLESVIDSPDNFTIFVNDDNKSVDINWTDVSGAIEYFVFYSNNLTDIEELNISYTTVLNYTVSDSNMTDFTAENNQTRYYRIASSSGTLRNLSDKIFAKHTFYLYGLDPDPVDNPHNKKNRISVIFENNYTAESLLQEIPYGRGVIIEKLIRISNTSYTYYPHIKGLGSNNFDIETGIGYNVEVNKSVEYTMVGEFNTSYSNMFELYGINVDPTDNPHNKKNWIGNVIPTSELAEDILQAVPNSRGQIIEKLVRESNTTYEYFPHLKGLGSNNFNIEVGSGYNLEVDGNVNYTR